MALGDALSSVRAAHAAYHNLIQPVATTLAGGAPIPGLETPPTLVMNVVCDRGEVLTSAGGVWGLRSTDGV